MADSPIQTRVRDGVAVATVESPPMNLLGGELMAALDVLGREIEANDAVRVLVLCPHFEPDVAPTGVVMSELVHRMADEGLAGAIATSGSCIETTTRTRKPSR